jgi:hypothetical protein
MIFFIRLPVGNSNNKLDEADFLLFLPKIENLFTTGAFPEGNHNNNKWRRNKREIGVDS